MSNTNEFNKKGATIPLAYDLHNVQFKDYKRTMQQQQQNYNFQLSDEYKKQAAQQSDRIENVFPGAFDAEGNFIEPREQEANKQEAEVRPLYPSNKPGMFNQG